MEIQHLREFIILANRLNYTSAAKAFFMAQPVLSRHIMQMEEELGVKLFIRDHHSVQLTAPGKAFQKSAHKILREYDDISARFAIMKSSSKQIFKYGIPFSAVDKSVNRLVKQYSTLYPEISIHCIPSTPENLLIGLLDQTIDVGLLFDVNLDEYYKFYKIIVGKSQLKLVMSENCPLNRLQPITPRDLDGISFQGMYDSYSEAFNRSVVDFFGKKGVSVSFDITDANNAEALLIEIANNDKATVLPADVIRSDYSNLIWRDIEGIDFSLDLALYFKTQTPLIHNFINLYLEFNQ